jgi:hypothetical protein
MLRLIRWRSVQGASSATLESHPPTPNFPLGFSLFSMCLRIVAVGFSSTPIFFLEASLHHQHSNRPPHPRPPAICLAPHHEPDAGCFDASLANLGEHDGAVRCHLGGPHVRIMMISRPVALACPIRRRIWDRARNPLVLPTRWTLKHGVKGGRATRESLRAISVHDIQPSSSPSKA